MSIVYAAYLFVTSTSMGPTSGFLDATGNERVYLNKLFGDTIWNIIVTETNCDCERQNRHQCKIIRMGKMHG